MASDPEEEEEDDMIDGGWGWVVVAASFMAHVIGDGCGFSFGILFSELLEAFGESKSTTAWVGSLFVSVPAICGPIASLCAKYMGCRCTTMLGGVVAALGCFAGSFSRNIGELCVSFGVIAGFGLSLVFVPAVVIVAFYFEKKRAFATGIAVAGSGIGTMIFAPITELLLQHYQWRGTLLICSAVLLNTVVCGAIFRPLKAEKEAVKKRKDSARNSDRSRSVKNCERNSHSNAHSNKEPHKSCDGNTHKHCCTQTHKTNCKNTPCKKHCNKNTCDKHLHSNPKSHRNKADDDDDVFIDDDSLTVKMLSRLTKLSAMSKQSGLSRLSEVSDSSDHVTRLYRSVPVLADVTKNEIKKSVYSGLAETANNNDDDDKTKLENKKNNKDENNNNNKTNQNFNVIEGTPSKVMTSSLPSLTPSELYPLLIHRQSLCVHKDVKKNLSIKNDFQNQKQLGAFVEIQNNLAQINTKKNRNNNNNKYNNINKNNKNNNRTTYNGNINDKRLPSNSHSTTNQLKQVKIDLLTPNKDLTSNFKALLTQYNIKPDPENLNFDLNINPTITINNISLNLKVKPSSTQNDVKLFQDKSEPRTALFKMAKNTLIPPHNMVPKSNMTARPCLRRGDMVYRGSLLRANFFSRITKSSSCPEVCLTPKKKYKKSKKQKLLSFFRSTKSSDSDKLSYQRIKIKLGHKCKEVMDLSLFRNSAFCLFNIHTILLYLSCDIPYLYSPNRATLIGIHHSSASYLVSIIGFFSMIGQILMGYLGDHPCINVTTFYNVTIAIAGVFVALIPHTFAFTTIALFHAAYGFFSSSNFALTTVILVELLGMDRLTDAFGIVSMSQGIANLLGPPIAGWLSDISSSYDMSFYLAGVMILISGLMLFSAPCLKRFDGEEEDESSDEDGNCSCCDGCCSCDSGEVGDDGFEGVEGGGDGEDGRDGGFDDGENMVVVKIKKASEEKDNNNDKNNKNKIKKNDNLTGNIDKRTDNDVNNNNSKNNSTENNKNENNNKNNTNNDNNNNVVVIIMNNGISHTKMKKMKNLI